MKHLLFICLILTGMIYNTPGEAQIKIGVFADCQYCDYETVGERYYRNSLTKLTDCISEFNNDAEIDFVVGLGDLIDRDYSSFEKVNSILKNSKKEVYHVIGNHDLSVKDEFLEKIPEQLNLSSTYYSVVENGWQFIFLNGNDITFQSTNKEVIKQAEKMVSELVANNKPNHHKWNGGIGKKQIKWLKSQLEAAQSSNYKVVLFCHYPLLPNGAHTLWNGEEILPFVEKYNCVKAWINGHNHAGDYATQNGIHFITFEGMVNTEMENAFATISLSEDSIEINGFGREKDRKLPIR